MFNALFAQQEKDVEESALDAKKRRRLGQLHSPHEIVQCVDLHRQPCITWQCLKCNCITFTSHLPLAERDPLHQGLIVERAKLKPRGYQLDLASRLGKTQVVTNSTPLHQQVWYTTKSKGYSMC